MMRKNEMQLRCAFSNKPGRYEVEIFDQRILPDFNYKVLGKHLGNCSNDDITDVEFYNCHVTKAPQGLKEIFPNFTSLSINKSELKHICKADLIEYKHLEDLTFDGNLIEFLPGDIFEGFNELESVSFENNKLCIIEPNIFDGLKNLSSVFLNGNSVKFRGYLREKSSKDANGPYNFFWQFRKNLFDIFCSSNKDAMMEFFTNIDLELQISKKRNNELLKALERRDLEAAEKSKDFMDEIDDLNQLIKKQKRTEEDKMSIHDFFKNDENLIDIKIKIDNSREFRVHKAFVAARSPTIAEMLKVNPKAKVLNLVDIPVDIFETILNYIYADELPVEDEVDTNENDEVSSNEEAINDEKVESDEIKVEMPSGSEEALQPVDKGINYIHLFAAAGHLRIDNLKNFAAAKIIEKNLFENPREILDLSLKYQHSLLMQKACDEIRREIP